MMIMRCQAIYTGLSTPSALAKNFVTRMLTRDLFDVANLLVKSLRY